MASKKRKQKLVLVFDENDRREYITGFRKRKNARRKQAEEELKKKEEEELKQTRAEKREALQRQIEENERGLDEDSDQEIVGAARTTHDFGEHLVTVSTITAEDMGPTIVTNKYREKGANEQEIKNNRNLPKSRQDNKKKFRRKAQKRKIQALSDKRKSMDRKSSNKKKKA